MINENKMWYKTIPEILNWLESKSEMNWLFLDTETTGLKGPKKDQVTQVSGIVVQYNYSANTFNELDTYDQKIKLNTDIKSRYNTPGDSSRRILSFNHYGSGQYKYKNENEVITDFFGWLDNYSPLLLVAQNAGFDMGMLSVRSGIKIDYLILKC